MVSYRKKNTRKKLTFAIIIRIKIEQWVKNVSGSMKILWFYKKKKKRILNVIELLFIITSTVIKFLTNRTIAVGIIVL